VGEEESVKPNLTGGIAVASHNRKIDQRNQLRREILAQLEAMEGGDGLG
jgi:hypothetical protein